MNNFENWKLTTYFGLYLMLHSFKDTAHSRSVTVVPNLSTQLWNCGACGPSSIFYHSLSHGASFAPTEPQTSDYRHISVDDTPSHSTHAIDEHASYSVYYGQQSCSWPVIAGHVDWTDINPHLRRDVRGTSRRLLVQGTSNRPQRVLTLPLAMNKVIGSSVVKLV